MTGGNQLKLSSFITGTAFGDAILAALRSAVPSSAGRRRRSHPGRAHDRVRLGRSHSEAADEPAGGRARAGARDDLDQHFEQRNRYGRLLSLVAQSPSLLGMGVDEDTAAVIRDARLERGGRGAVTVVDGRQLVSNAYAAKRTAPLLVSGAVLHVLPAGGPFDLATRSLVVFETPVPEQGGGGVRAAESDLRTLADEIAAEGVSPTDYAQYARRRRQQP